MSVDVSSSGIGESVAPSLRLHNILLLTFYVAFRTLSVVTITLGRRSVRFFTAVLLSLFGEEHQLKFLRFSFSMDRHCLFHCNDCCQAKLYSYKYLLSFTSSRWEVPHLCWRSVKTALVSFLFCPPIVVVRLALLVRSVLRYAFIA